jgi:hypothetical protein
MRGNTKYVDPEEGIRVACFRKEVTREEEKKHKTGEEDHGQIKSLEVLRTHIKQLYAGCNGISLMAFKQVRVNMSQETGMIQVKRGGLFTVERRQREMDLLTFGEISKKQGFL